MKKLILFVIALTATMTVSFAQNKTKDFIITDYSDLVTKKISYDQWVRTLINASGDVMFDGRIIAPEALKEPLAEYLLNHFIKQGKPYTFVIMKDDAISTSHPVFQTIAEQHVLAVQSLPGQPLPVRLHVGAPLPPPPTAPEVEVLEVVDEPEELVEIVEPAPLPVEEEDDSPVFIVVEEMPQFPGGQTAMFKFISDNLMYPAIAQANGIQGRVICQFIVNTDGSISGIEVVRSSGDPSLNKEAVRLIRSMPNWTPGKQRGKPVRVRYTIPINFKL